MTTVRAAWQDKENNNKVVINVSGYRFVTTKSTLANYPETKLGKLADLKAYSNQEHFFDEDEDVFKLTALGCNKGGILVEWRGLSGFIPASRSIHIDEPMVQRIDIQLEPEYGIVFINSQPADAKLTVDGKAMGTASRRLRLTSLPHRIVVSRAGYKSFKTTLTPTAGVSKKLA